MTQTVKSTVNKLELKPGVWRIKVNHMTYDHTGKRIDRRESYSEPGAGTFKGTEAQAEMQRMRVLLGLGVAQVSTQAADPAQGMSATAAAFGITLGEYADQWLERRLGQALTGQTPRVYRMMVNLYVKPCWGHFRLAGMAKADVLAGFAALAKRGCIRPEMAGRPLAAQTVAQVWTRLTSILVDASNEGLVNMKALALPEAKKALPRPAGKGNRTQTKALDEAQTQRLLTTVEHHWLGPLIRFALASGCRRGEMCALKWRSVKLTGDGFAKVQIVESIADDGLRIWAKTPKSDKFRTLLVAGAIVAELEAMRAKAQEIADALDMDVDDMRVFPNTLGEMMNPGDLTTAVRALLMRAKLGEFTLHSTRHTHASTLLRNGMNISAVSARLGHSDPGFTLRVYSWAMPSEDYLLAQTMAAAMGGKVAAQATTALAAGWAEVDDDLDEDEEEMASA